MFREAFSKRLLHLLSVNRMMFRGPCKCAYHFQKTNIPRKGGYAAHVKGEGGTKRLEHLVVRISRNRRSDPFEESGGERVAPRPADSQAEYGARFSTNGGTDNGGHFTASPSPNDESEKSGKEYLLNELNEFVSVGKRREEGGGTVKSSTQGENPNESGHLTQDDPPGQREHPVGVDHDEEVKLERLLKKRQGIKRDIVTITEKARDEIKKLIKEYHSKEDKDTNYVLKLFYIIKGCNGLTHSFNFVHRNELHVNDELIFEDESRKNILLAIDSKCVLYVINTTLDYYRDDLTERFIFTNPNVTSVCPCGTSFHFNPGGS
ncbi:iron-sulfur assembly protein, putative [Plasmodium knowlesi strain H]|uniref:Iron-sulfur assembly protein, putative n=3 Tax=Plasmodium knowlesi TaxID=5850 RepID=A0A5K1V506_PLAKH|nr:iron-sulfur assembly protein, putative [Plasmodium knowlesi strain H]OTN66086.1 putative HesB family member [Plasmodium knowlesi]CAA9987826.1 iron-sulfur assembly protein, putative [Plasmodium knowlesi strain H]SBO22367.1 iron-sulfur assembly protein, putative [Plasmodium knowlesi strain H]VVS77300.1 iron-sulfur assembly protein, putative [Plasmodium knowlesi strain H]|eukprot:XP_002258824.1 HesB family member, putative [Plasmodium knowlesi strain H]